MCCHMQVLIIALLVMPMPSNKVRGIVQGGLSKFWHTQEYVKKTSWVLLTLNSYYLYGEGCCEVLGRTDSKLT